MIYTFGDEIQTKVWWYTKSATWIRKNLIRTGWGFFWWSIFNESRTTNEITYGDEILVSLGWNLQPAASDEIKSANLTSRKRDLIALAISSTYVDLFRISGFSWKNLTLLGRGFFWWSIFNESWTTNEITYGDEILVSLGWNLQPAASDEIKSAIHSCRKADFIA